MNIKAAVAKERTYLQDYLIKEEKSALKKYQEVAVGSIGLWSLIKYEIFTIFLAGFPGALGLFLRRLFSPLYLKSIGENTFLGKGITIRHPSKISIGENVIIDENVVLDAKGDSNKGLVISDNVIISRNNILSCKGGDIEIGDNTNIAQNGIIHSETSVKIGSNVLIAAFSYIVAGGNHSIDRIDIPVIQQPSYSKGGVVIEDNVWLGARVTVLDGVRIGRDSIIGAGAVVMDNIPEFSIAVGVPAKVIRNRRAEVSKKEKE